MFVYYTEEMQVFYVNMKNSKYRYVCFAPCPSSVNIINCLFSPELHILQKEDESYTSEVS
jgi:hypothetical protein